MKRPGQMPGFFRVSNVRSFHASPHPHTPTLDCRSYFDCGVCHPWLLLYSQFLSLGRLANWDSLARLCFCWYRVLLQRVKCAQRGIPVRIESLNTAFRTAHGASLV